MGRHRGADEEEDKQGEERDPMSLVQSANHFNLNMPEGMVVNAKWYTDETEH